MLGSFTTALLSASSWAFWPFHSESLEPASCWNAIFSLLFCQLLLQVSDPRAHFQSTGLSWNLNIRPAGHLFHPHS